MAEGAAKANPVMMFVDNPTTPHQPGAAPHSYGRAAALFGSVARLGCSFEGLRLQLAISLQQDLHFAFGFLQLLAAGTGKFHALIKKLQRVVKGDVSLLKFSYDFFQSLETLFEFRQAQTPVVILVQNDGAECENFGHQAGGAEL